MGEMTTTREVTELAAEYRRRFPDWRPGQAAFNALFYLEPDLANEIRGIISLDPFYAYNEDDPRLTAFWSWASVVLDGQGQA